MISYVSGKGVFPQMMIKQKEKKKAKFRVSFLFLFIFASFAVCFVLYMKEDFEITSDMIEKAEDAVVYVEPVGITKTVVNPVPKSEKAEENYYKDAVFVGSTVLAGLSDYGYVESDNMLLSDSINLGNFNTVVLSANGTESIISDTAAIKKAGKLYIMVGIDDLDSMSGAEPFSELEAFIDSIKEKNWDTKIYLMSLLPVTSGNESRIALNSDVDMYNSLLLEFANKMNVYYLDVNTGFKGNDGKLPSSSTEINGIKLKKSGYEQLSEYILTHIG